MALIELPYGLPGRIFAGQMPFGDFDPFGENILQIQEHQITMVVLLNPDDEIKRISGRDLKRLYAELGLDVLHLPIGDNDIPTMIEIQQAVWNCLARARTGENIVVHCRAGLGRTGTILACLAREALGMSGGRAITWTRQHIPGAIETYGQISLILNYPAQVNEC